MKKFREPLREHAMKMINFKKKKMKLIANKQLKSYEMQIEKFEDKKYLKIRDHCHYTGEYRGTTHSICNLKCSIPKEIPVVFHNRSNYDYHFIIKEVAEEFKRQFNCLVENTEKCIKIQFQWKKKLI